MAYTSANGGILDLNGFNQTFSSLSSGAGGGSIRNSGGSASTLTVDGSASTSFGLVISNAIHLVKAGTGTLTLTAANTYTGDTTISGGTLALSGSGSIASTNITVASGATFDLSGRTTTLVLQAGRTLRSSATGTNATATLFLRGTNFSLTNATLEFSDFQGGTNAPLTVTGTNPSALDLNGTPVRVTVPAPLAANQYKLIAKAGSATGVSGTPGAFTATGLATNTYATLSVSNGELWMNVAEFSPPSVTTGAVAFTNNQTALIGTNSFYTNSIANNVTSDGGKPISERGVVYGTSPLPNTGDNKLTSPGDLGSFSSALTNLTPGTTYYLRAYAVNSVGTSYGSEISFSTPSYASVDGIELTLNFAGLSGALSNVFGWSTSDEPIFPQGEASNGFQDFDLTNLGADPVRTGRIGNGLANSPNVDIGYQFSRGDSDKLVFIWDQVIVNSTDDYPGVDRFGWAFRHKTATNTTTLFSFRFLPEQVVTNDPAWFNWDENVETTNQPVRARPDQLVAVGFNGTNQPYINGNPVLGLGPEDQPNFLLFDRSLWQDTDSNGVVDFRDSLVLDAVKSVKFRVTIDLENRTWSADYLRNNSWFWLVNERVLPDGVTDVNQIVALWDLQNTNPIYANVYSGGANAMHFSGLSITGTNQNRTPISLTLSASNRVYNSSPHPAIVEASPDSSVGARIQYWDTVSGLKLTSAPVAAGTYTAKATVLSNAIYAATPQYATFTIGQATPNITWSNPASITYLTPLSTNQLNATADAPGEFAYDPTNGTVLNAGIQTLTAVFTPSDTTNYVATPQTNTVTLMVDPATPTITWTNPAAITFGTPLSSTQLNATVDVDGNFVAGELVYTPSAGDQLNAGTQILSAVFTPFDTNNYRTVTNTVTLVVNPAFPNLTWNNPSPITYGTPLSGTQLNATADVNGSFDYDPAAGAILNAGTHTLSVVFTPTDTTNYVATSAYVSLIVNQATPNITWTNPAAITYGTALTTDQLNATADVDGAFSYDPSSGAVLNAGTNTLNVVFTPTDTNNYVTATNNVSLVVNQATPNITWTNPAAITYGTALSTNQLNATADVNGSFDYAPAAGAILNAGTNTLSVVFTPTDTNNYVPATNNVSLVVNKASQTITFPILTNGVAGQFTNLTATSSATNLTVTYTSSDTNKATISGSTLNFVGVGSVTITAIQPGDNNYEAAEDVFQTIQVLSPDTPWDVWADSYGLFTSALRTHLADPDADGFVNSLEFAFGTDPTTKNREIFVSRGPVVTNAVTNYVVTFKKRRDPSQVTYDIRQSTNLRMNFTNGTPMSFGTNREVDANYDETSVSLPYATNRGFIRMQATVNVHPTR